MVIRGNIPSERSSPTPAGTLPVRGSAPRPPSTRPPARGRAGRCAPGWPWNTACSPPRKGSRASRSPTRAGSAHGLGEADVPIAGEDSFQKLIHPEAFQDVVDQRPPPTAWAVLPVVLQGHRKNPNPAPLGGPGEAMSRMGPQPQTVAPAGPSNGSPVAQKDQSHPWRDMASVKYGK